MEGRTHHGLALAAAGLWGMSSMGCAIHYFDQATQTEHIWGFGHMAMKVAPASEGVRAVVRGVDTIGLGVGSLPEQGYAAVGWQSVRRLEVVGESTTLRLEWPTADFFNVRVGSEFPRFQGDRGGETDTGGEMQETTP